MLDIYHIYKLSSNTTKTIRDLLILTATALNQAQAQAPASHPKPQLKSSTRPNAPQSYQSIQSVCPSLLS